MSLSIGWNILHLNHSVGSFRGLIRIGHLHLNGVDCILVNAWSSTSNSTVSTNLETLQTSSIFDSEGGLSRNRRSGNRSSNLNRSTFVYLDSCVSRLIHIFIRIIWISLRISLRRIVNSLAVVVDLRVEFLAILLTITIRIRIQRIRVTWLAIWIRLMILKRILRTVYLVAIVDAILIGIRIKRVGTVIFLFLISQTIAISIRILRISTILLLILVLDAVVIIVVILDIWSTITISIQKELSIHIIGHSTRIRRIGYDNRNSNLLGICTILTSRSNRHTNLTSVLVDSYGITLRSREVLINSELRIRRIRITRIRWLHLGGLTRWNNCIRVARFRVHTSNRHGYLGSVLRTIRISNCYSAFNLVATLSGVRNLNRHFTSVWINRYRRTARNRELRTLRQVLVTRLRNLHRLARLTRTRLIRRIVLIGLRSLRRRNILDSHLYGLVFRRSIWIRYLHSNRILSILLNLTCSRSNSACFLVNLQILQIA